MCERTVRMEKQIPKRIHLFWFGGGIKSPIIEKCIASWKEFAPDFEVVEWNESNFDVFFCERSKQAYEAKKWAFVADIARLKVIYEQGGYYFDTDVQMTAPLNEMLHEMPEASTFFLFHNERFIGTGYGFGAIAGSGVIGHLLKNYEKMPFELKHGIFGKVCTQIETEALEEYYHEFVRNNMLQKFDDGTVVLPTSFWQKYLLHYGTGTWVEDGRECITNDEKIKRNIRIMKGFRNPKCFKMIRQAFGRKAEYVYEFLVYDLMDMGVGYFVSRLLKKIGKKIKRN